MATQPEKCNRLSSIWHFRLVLPVGQSVLKILFLLQLRALTQLSDTPPPPSPLVPPQSVRFSLSTSHKNAHSAPIPRLPQFPVARWRAWAAVPAWPLMNGTSGVLGKARGYFHRSIGNALSGSARCSGNCSKYKSTRTEVRRKNAFISRYHPGGLVEASKEASVIPTKYGDRSCLSRTVSDIPISSPLHFVPVAAGRYRGILGHRPPPPSGGIPPLVILTGWGQRLPYMFSLIDHCHQRICCSKVLQLMPLIGRSRSAHARIGSGRPGPEVDCVCDVSALGNGVGEIWS